MKKKTILDENIQANDVPRVLNVFFPGRCNLQCKYCFVHKEVEYFNDINEESIRREVDIFFDYPGKQKALSFNGGEPLLEWNLIKKICAYAKQQARKKKLTLNVSIVTNGTLLKKEHVDFFSKHNIAVRISIDGDRKTHDSARPFKAKNGKSSFDAIMKNIDEIGIASLNFSASLVFGPNTITDLLDNIKFLQAKGFKQIDFYPEIYATWSAPELKKLKIEMAKIKQYYINIFDENNNLFKTSLVDVTLNGSAVGKQAHCGKIQADGLGNFYACDKVFSLPKKHRGKYLIGDVKIGIDNEKREKLLATLREKHAEKNLLTCSSCKLRKYCFCPIGQHLYYENMGIENLAFWRSSCAISKILIEAGLDVVKRLRYNDLFVKLNRF
ncbi:MAG: radical SAM protein [Candidatus Moranbacteria bacterium]|nr:radical SAM protein [Candidatus Moranbacteria bacterium]